MIEPDKKPQENTPVPEDGALTLDVDAFDEDETIAFKKRENSQ